MKLSSRNRILRSDLVKLVVFIVIAVVAGSAVITTLRAQVEGDKYSYAGRFTNVSGLYEGDDVRVAGVPVGSVTGIELDHGEAVVTFTVKESVTLRESVELAVYYQNLVGQRYLAIIQGSDAAPKLSAETTIGVDHTVDSFDVTALFNGFKPLFDALDPSSVNEFAVNVLHLVQGDGAGLQQTLDSLARITEHLVSRETLIRYLIDALGTLSDVVAGKSGQVVELLVQLQDVISHLTSKIDGVLNAVKWSNRTLVPAIEILTMVESLWDDNVEPIGQLLERNVPYTPTGSEVLTLIADFLRAIRTGVPVTESGALALCRHVSGTAIEAELC